jgi:hypothetical protein
MSPISLTDSMTAYDRTVGGLTGNWLPFFAVILVLVFDILGYAANSKIPRPVSSIYAVTHGVALIGLLTGILGLMG